MRTITGTIKSTPTQWLSALSNIGPPEIRRQIATQSMISKIKRNGYLPIYNNIEHHPNKRLKSRFPIWEVNTNYNDLKVEWKGVTKEAKTETMK